MHIWKTAGCILAVWASGSPTFAANLTKTITLPDGRTREISVLVPESKARSYESRGYHRSASPASRADAVRYRDEICKLAASPPPRSKAPFTQMCSDATAAVLETASGRF